MKKIDLTGAKFGRLTVIAESPVKTRNKVSWICKCDCGNTTQPIPGNSLRSGNTKSCGCIHAEGLRQRLTVHGLTGTRLYRIWQGMLRRCDNPKRKDYKDYGARGIAVCDEWKNSFQVFHDWALSNGYEEHLTIDRKDVDDNYCPQNCRWATRTEQVHNRRKAGFDFKEDTNG